MWRRAWATLMALVFCVSAACAVPTAALAQAASSTTKKKNFAERHPTVTGVAAGVAAYKVAKKTGKNRKMAGQKRNFAQRHPVLTGVATGVTVRHYAKKSGKNKK